MMTLKFHDTLYSADVLGLVAQRYQPYGSIEMEHRSPYLELRVEPNDPASTEVLVGAIENAALALFIEAKRP